MYVGYYHDHQRYEDESSEEECEHCARQNIHYRDETDQWPRYEEPPWSGHIKDKGDVFYIEPYNEPSSNGMLESLQQLKVSGRESPASIEKDKGKPVLRSFNSVKNLLPGLKRESKSNNERNLQHSVPDSMTDGVVNSAKMPGRFYKKEVQLIVTPPKGHVAGLRNDLESLLGIIPGRDKTGKLSQNDSYSGSRLYVKGFVPDGPALRSGELRIGDVLLSLNKLDLNSSNVNTILAAITGPMEITLMIQRTIQPKVSSPVILQSALPKNDSHLIKLISGQLPASLKPDLKNVPHVALYLTMSSSDENDKLDQDIVYQYPKSEVATRLVALRGMFLTLSDLMSSVTGNTANSSSLVMDKKLVYAVYSTVNRDVLVIALPADSIPLCQLSKMASDVCQILALTFGSVERAFCDKFNKARLDHLFSLLFEKTLVMGHGDSSSITKVPDFLPGVQCLHLPVATEVQVHCCLNDLEAADYGEFADEFFQIRRLYTILGSCMFYKGYLVGNHLIREDLEDAVLYCKYHCLLAMSAEQRVGQLVFWREVFPTRRQRPRHDGRRVDDYNEPEARFFLLIVGMKHWVACTLLEAGGISRQADGHPPPDSYYVDQVKNILHQVEAMDIPSVCEARLRSPANPPVTSSDMLLFSPAVTSQKPPSSTSTSNTPNSQRKHSSLDNLRIQGDDIESSDSGSVPSTLRRKGSDSSGSAGSLGMKGRLRSFRSQFSLNSIGTLRKSLPESLPDFSQMVTSKLTGGTENTLFHYVSWDSFNGVVVCPSGVDGSTGGAIHAEVLNTFYKTCLSIRRLFSPYYKQRLKPKADQKSRFASSGMQSVVEHGVLFQRTPENSTEQKKASSVLKYWVLGRLFPGEHPRELYVCHHHSVPQSTVELAFKLGFGVGP